MALGKFNISIVSADSNTIKQTAISPHWRPCLNWWLTLHSPAFYVKPDRHARSTNKQQKEGIRFTSGAASKWSLNGGAGFWLYGAESRCICRLAARSDTQKLQGPLSVTGPSPANGSHSHLSAGWQRWRIHRSASWNVSLYFIIVFVPRRCTSWELEAARSVHHATKEGRGAGQSSLASKNKAWVTSLKEAGTHRSRSESLSVWPGARIKEMSVTVARLVCLMGVAPLFVMLRLKIQVTLRQLIGLRGQG